MNPTPEPDGCQLRRSNHSSSSRANAVCRLHQRRHPSISCGTRSSTWRTTHLIRDTEWVPLLQAYETSEMHQTSCSNVLLQRHPPRQFIAMTTPTLWAIGLRGTTHRLLGLMARSVAREIPARRTRAPSASSISPSTSRTRADPQTRWSTYLTRDALRVPKLHLAEKAETNQSLSSVGICLDAFTPTKNPTTWVIGSWDRCISLGDPAGSLQVVVCIPWIR